MNDAVLLANVLQATGSTGHKRRHRHQSALDTARDSNRDKYQPGNTPERAESSGNTVDTSFKTHAPPQRATEFNAESLSKPFSESMLANPRLATASVNYVQYPNNSTLTFHRSFRNAKISTTLTRPYYYEISSRRDETTDYQQSGIIPFNTDEESQAPHFDAEFFPEPITPDENSTVLGLRDAYGTFPLTPSSVSRATLEDVHYSLSTSTSFGHFNVSSFFNATSRSTVFSHSYDYLTPKVNSSTVTDGSLNTSFYSGSGTNTDDLYTWSILIMAPLVIFGVAGNTLVILAISLEKRLQNVTNYFLLSLAVTDLLVSLIVMPLSIINVFTGRWLFGLLLCDFFVTSDVLMCTSSILHLCTISLERYIGIRYPLWTKNKSKRIVLLKIVLVWTIALAITSPITVLGVVKEENVLVHGACVLNNVHFMMYGSIFAFYIPLSIMVLMYALTVRMLNKQARMCQSRRANNGEGQPMIRRSTSRRNWQPRRKYYGREALGTTLSYSGTQVIEEDGTDVVTPFHQRYRSSGVNRHNTIPLCHYHHNDFTRRDGAGGSNGSLLGSRKSIQRGRTSNNITGPNNSNSYNTDVSSNTLRGCTSGKRSRYSSQNGSDSTAYLGLPPEYPYCNGHHEEVNPDLQSDSHNCSRLSSSSSSSSPTSSTNRESKLLPELVRKHHVAVKAANMLLMKRENQGQSQQPAPSSSTHASVRRDNSVKTEQKASKVLGVVFMIFVICWAPFFTVNILTPLCTSCEFEPTLITAFVWLGYVSSTLNPIIYTIFNNIFRITFIKLLCCRYRLLHRARRSSTMPGGARNGAVSYTDCTQAHPSTATTANTTSTTFLDESNC